MMEQTDIDFLEDPLPESPPIRLSPDAMRQLESELDRKDDTPPAALVDLIRRRPVWAAH